MGKHVKAICQALFAYTGSLKKQANRFEIGSHISVFTDKESETEIQIKPKHGVGDEVPAEELLALGSY